MTNYGWGYYDDQWAGKTIGGKTASGAEQSEAARRYAALMGGLSGLQDTVEELQDSADSDDASYKKIFKPRYYTYEMRSRKPYYETKPTRPASNQRSPYHDNPQSVRTGYEAFRARYGKDFPVPPLRTARPNTAPSKEEQGIEKQPEVKLVRERSVKFRSTDDVDPEQEMDPESADLVRVRLLSVSPEPDLPTGKLSILQAEDPEVIEKKSRKKPKDKGTSWLLYSEYPQVGEKKPWKKEKDEGSDRGTSWLLY